MGRLLLLAIPIAVAVYAFIDVLTTPGSLILRGPKWLWAIAVLVLPLLGAVLWFIAGRPPRRRAGRAVTAPDDDPDFLRQLKKDMPPREEDPPQAPA